MKGSFSFSLQVRIDARHQSLTGRFLVSGGPIDLTGEIQARYTSLVSSVWLSWVGGK